MYAIVTGSAGFIGSHVSERLLAQGFDVHGVDCLTPYYDPDVKRGNLRELEANDRFTSVEADLRTADLEELIDGADVVYHLAAQPGVRGSWADGFQRYVEHNVLATQRLLEAARTTDLSRLVYASSSSVYGNAERYPCQESDEPSPHSPYGVTKMSAEHLCRAYADNFGLETVSLRYFTVYGPRQRPEMAASRLIESALTGEPFPLFGDGSAVRDFTYVGDIARATVDAGLADVPAGEVMNVGGGAPVSVAQLIDLVAEATGHEVPVDQHGASPGDVQRTGGDTSRVGEVLEWEPHTDLAEGVRRQVQAQSHELALA
ncbi:NAD-dependent epimerase/dehydratase family protein [Egicoccus halophilus]|uniref:Putative UDP-glucose epimerase YtcB n=1 Tax=Egicoccus halophilus TaxID=1670830 RepID=A0A8J3EUY9_9ACTN|nr:NAD-dependent epimerase/dehydratase family protein [Egicoccus halophilus]GGI08628.1 putative UDP-glucose epimerase YtcB [Egicoccus halophilus]